MPVQTEGYLFAISALSAALLGTLLRNGTLSPKDMAELTDSAELFFSQLSPAMMSPKARDYARQVLQQVLEGYQPKPDAGP